MLPTSLRPSPAARHGHGSGKRSPFSPTSPRFGPLTLPAPFSATCDSIKRHLLFSGVILLLFCTSLFFLIPSQEETQQRLSRESRSRFVIEEQTTKENESPQSPNQLPIPSYSFIKRQSPLNDFAKLYSASSTLPSSSSSSQSSLPQPTPASSLPPLPSPPSPHSPALLHFLTRRLLIGVMGYSRTRVSAIESSWGAYVPHGHIFYYTDEPWIENPRVVVLPHARWNESTTDRRSSAWKIFPAIRHMYESASEEVEFFYLCDDDSFPLIHQLTVLIAQYQWNSSQLIYAGESTAQDTYMKAYYESDEASGKVGRKVSLAYQCTGGGVIMSRAMMKELVSVLHLCPIFFASDVSLGYCVHEFTPMKSLTRITTIHHAYPRSPEEVEKKYKFTEELLTQALAYHHMKPPFIYDMGGVPQSDSAEKYLTDTVERMYQYWIVTLAMGRWKEEMTNEGMSGSEGSTTLALTAPTSTAHRDQHIPLLRVAFVDTRAIISPLSNLLSSLVHDQLNSLFFNSDPMLSLPFGYGLFSQHMFQTDYIHTEWKDDCDPCSRSSVCQQSLTLSVHELFPRFQHTQALRSVPLDHPTTSLTMSEIDWSAYDLVISIHDIFSREIQEELKQTTLFVHVPQVTGCDGSNADASTSSTAKLYDPSLPPFSSSSDAPPPSNAIRFPLSSPFAFTFFGLTYLQQVQFLQQEDQQQQQQQHLPSSNGSITQPPIPTVDTALLAQELHALRNMHYDVVVVDIAVDAVQPVHLEEWKTIFLSDAANTTTSQPATTSPNIISTATQSRLEKMRIYSSASFCVFTGGFMEYSTTTAASSPTSNKPDDNARLDDILLSITCGCYAIISSTLITQHPPLSSLLPSSQHHTSLTLFVPHMQQMQHDPTQPFATRYGLIRKGEQRQALNRVAMEEPIEKFMQDVEKLL